VTYPVVERIEINDYPITPTIAQRIAQERLARVILGSSLLKLRGPAEGCQQYHPFTHHATTITRTLDWTGNGYRYEMEITSPRVVIGWGSSGWNATGWW
jgi:hypothetical protein